MSSILVLNARLVNEGSIQESDLLIKGERIELIAKDLSGKTADKVIDAQGKLLMPGLIDDQVHFREPGLTHKANIYTESRAAVAGGITSFMEMPNTVPQALSQTLLEDKYKIGQKTSLANYSFFMGVSNDNMEQVLKTDKKKVCGLKIFMGSSTGNMLVDKEEVLRGVFSSADMLIAVHCEDEETIRRNTSIYKEKYGDDIPISAHPLIRSEEACYKSSSYAVELAKEYDTQLHILHISTAKETNLFSNSLPLKEKRITSEACIHHLWFDDTWYDRKGSLIKWNPAVKKASDKDEILKAVLDDRIDVIATDHAPHTLEEKDNRYLNAPSGGPLVQHSLVAMLDLYHQGKIELTRIVDKMCHNPAILFRVEERGYIREGYYADLVLVDPDSPWTVNKDNVLAKCGWSPFEDHQFKSTVASTIVSGHLAYHKDQFDESTLGKRLTFNR